MPCHTLKLPNGRNTGSFSSAWCLIRLARVDPVLSTCLHTSIVVGGELLYYMYTRGPKRRAERARHSTVASSPSRSTDSILVFFLTFARCSLLFVLVLRRALQGELANAMARRKSSGAGLGAGGPGRGGPPAVPYSAPAPVGGGSRSPPPSMPAPMPGRGAPMPGRPGVGAPAIPGKVCVCFLLVCCLLYEP